MPGPVRPDHFEVKEVDKVILGLVELQRLDIRLKVLDDFLESAPQERAALDDEKKQAEADMDNKREELDETKKTLHRAESGLADREEKIRQITAKLNQVKTNKEYEAALKEIDEQKRHIGKLEEEILQLYDKVEEVQQQRQKLEAGWKDWLREFEGRRSELESRISAAEKELEARRADRESLAPTLDDEAIKLYDKSSQKKGRALARADKEVCLGCNVHVPAQLYNEVLQGSRVINCSGCQRILVHLPEELDDGLLEISA